MKNLLIPVMGLAAALLACGAAESVVPPSETATPSPLTSFGLQDVCAGQSQDRAAPYTPEGPVNPAIIFIRESENDNYIERSTFVDSFPEDEWLRSFGTYEEVEVVACLTVVERELVETCEYSDDDNPDDISLLETYNTTYSAVVYNASTGEELASGTLFGPADDCPMFAFFDGDGSVEIEDGEPAAELIELLQPIVEP